MIPGLEKEEDWQEHKYGILENLAPVGHLEINLAERVALLSWRLHRVTRYETGAIAISQETIEDDIHERDRFLSVLRHKGLEITHPEDIRSEAKYYKQAHGALRRFPSLASDKTLKEADASSVVWGVLMEAKKASGEDIDVEALDLPGVPEDAIIEELPAMKAADVRGVGRPSRPAFLSTPTSYSDSPHTRQVTRPGTRHTRRRRWSGKYPGR